MGYGKNMVETKGNAMIAVYTVRLRTVDGSVAIDSFNSRQFLTEEAALDEARKTRDALNSSEYGVRAGAPYRITRGYQRDKARQL
jgi:hypothetical protein